MIDFNDRHVKDFTRDLTAISRRSIPFAVRQALNDTAFGARSVAQDVIGTKFIIKNRWTKGSIFVNRATGLDVSNMTAEMGSAMRYMAKQEYGGVKRARGRFKGVPIPTSYSAGQGRQKPRTKPPRPTNRASRIKFTSVKQNRPGTKKSTQAVIREAAAKGARYIYLDTGRRKGIYKRLGGKRNPRVEMIVSLTKRAVRIPATRWLAPTIDMVLPTMTNFYIRALQREIDRASKKKYA